MKQELSIINVVWTLQISLAKELLRTTESSAKTATMKIVVIMVK